MKNRKTQNTTIVPGSGDQNTQHQPSPFESYMMDIHGSRDQNTQLTSRPTITGGRLYTQNTINRDNNTMHSSQQKFDRRGNTVYNKEIDYNKIPFRNKAIDAINRFDYNLSKKMNLVGDALQNAPKNTIDTFKNTGENIGKVLNKDLYTKYPTKSEIDGKEVIGTEYERPTITGGRSRKEVYSIPKNNNRQLSQGIIEKNKGKRIIRTRFNEEGMPIRRTIRDRKIN